MRDRALCVASLLLFSCATAGGGSDEAEVRTIRFESSDGIALFADIHPSRQGRRAPLVLLFHQGGGDARGEYGPIIPRLVDNGMNVMAVDLRGGGERFGRNRTVDAIGGKEYSYCEAYRDLEASLARAATEGFTGPRIVWGSSYTATLAIRLAAEHPEGIAAVLAFSPAGSGPMESCRPDPHLMALEMPLLALRPSSELAIPAVVNQNALIRGAGHAVWVASDGTHGSSMLVAERVEGDVEPTWEKVLRFIEEALTDFENASRAAD